MTIPLYDPPKKAAPVALPLLDRIQAALDAARAKGASEADIAAVLRRVIHGPLAAVLVKLTPNPIDDMVLEVLKALFPA